MSSPNNDKSSNPPLIKGIEDPSKLKEIRSNPSYDLNANNLSPSSVSSSSSSPNTINRHLIYYNIVSFLPIALTSEVFFRYTRMGQNLSDSSLSPNAVSARSASFSTHSKPRLNLTNTSPFRPSIRFSIYLISIGLNMMVDRYSSTPTPYKAPDWFFGFLDKKDQK
jgi:hypothetical protein